ncbi:hypothetical protein M0R45_030876 [Rubus argutus]|uniref:Uncharacterized protein n=1 Tax=Rubus argutus TaxID=59490 RepID=A0AAW1WCM9_RUBAR
MAGQGLGPVRWSRRRTDLRTRLGSWQRRRDGEKWAESMTVASVVKRRAWLVGGVDREVLAVMACSGDVNEDWAVAWSGLDRRHGLGTDWVAGKKNGLSTGTVQQPR